MSIHTSLSSSLKNKKQRSVLKRIERIKYFLDKGSFNEQSPVFGLPKIKVMKIKVIKKEKTAETTTPGAAVAPGAGPAGAKGLPKTAPKALGSTSAKPAK